VFGCLAALRLADMGCHVTLYEAGGELLTGASLANQNRLHMGYHYPRSPETAKACAVFEKGFRRAFPSCVVDFEHYYAVERDSKIAPAEFEDVCFEIGDEYYPSLEPPDGVRVLGNITEWFKVKEGIIDIGCLRKRITAMMSGRVEVRYYDPVKRARRLGRHWMIGGVDYDCVINATYGNINTLAMSSGFYVEPYQYELCEVVVIKNPFKRRMGIGIMDGPFFGVLPFGLSDKYLLYDVDHSVLARTTGLLPEIEVMDPDNGAEERFERYIHKAVCYLPDMGKAERLYSMYALKVTKANRDADDARPTEIIHNGEGFFSIFAGKISAAIPSADRLAMEVQEWLEK